MFGLNKKNADNVYHNLIVNETAIVNRIVSRVQNNLSTSGPTGPDGEPGQEGPTGPAGLPGQTGPTGQFDSSQIVADSVSALSVSAEAYSSPFGGVSADWGSSNPITVTNNALVGKIILNNVTPGSIAKSILVQNTNISAGDLVFLTQLTDPFANYLSPLYLLTVQNGSFSVSATPISGGGKSKPGAVEIGYFVVKNSD